MAAVVRSGQRRWSMRRDDEGHREYKISHLVVCDKTDGPAVALSAPGLPTVGTYWNFDSDLDIWAYCTPEADVEPVIQDEPNKHFLVTQTFTTKPPDVPRCNDHTVEDPLLEPDRVSGTFVKYIEEATYDKDGNPLLNSAYEQIRGPSVEFDKSKMSISIEQNVADLQLALINSMMDTVNTAPLWGLPARTIKLSGCPWSKKYYGTCNYYYVRTLEFDIDYNTFDRTVLDEGTKVLNGHWDTDTGEWVLEDINGANPSIFNPNHFIRSVDFQGNPMRILLNGYGMPAGVTVSYGESGTGTGTSFDTSIGSKTIRKYAESNFLLLGIPTSI